MEKTEPKTSILISLQEQDFETYLTGIINSCLKNNPQNSSPAIKLPDRPLNLKEAAAFLSVTVATLYSMISKNELPSMKRRKLRYILLSDLLAYLEAGKSASKAEIDEKTKAYFRNKRRKGGHRE